MADLPRPRIKSENLVWSVAQLKWVVMTQPGAAAVATTATVTAVPDNAASVTLVAANSSRIGASVTNDSSAKLYVKTGTTATATDYTVPLVSGAYWEAPYGYTGRIDGIWASDPNDGAARVTEYT